MNQGLPKRLRMFAGPNGSGKSSLARKLAKEFSPRGLFRLNHFVNADDLLQHLEAGQGIALDEFSIAVSEEQLRSRLVSGHRLPDDHPFLGNFKIVGARLTAPPSALDGYLAAAIADFLREELLKAGASFSFETVMSHRSKVDFLAEARANGYRTYLYFIAVDSPLINQHRVQTRVREGGHSVSQEKIANRYFRSLQLVNDALQQVYRGFIFDNSGIEPVVLAELGPHGRFDLRVPEEELPGWFRTYLGSRLRL